MKILKIKRETICAKCLEKKTPYNHRFPADHNFDPRLETIAEAAYRQGYEEGAARAESKAHWNSGGISWN